MNNGAMFAGLILGALLGFVFGVLVTMSTVRDIVCHKNDPSCRIVRCERIVEEGGKKTCERWGE